MFICICMIVVQCYFVVSSYSINVPYDVTLAQSLYRSCTLLNSNLVLKLYAKVIQKILLNLRCKL